jgi:ankyrin repeat protein
VKLAAKISIPVFLEKFTRQSYLPRPQNRQLRTWSRKKKNTLQQSSSTMATHPPVPLLQVSALQPKPPAPVAPVDDTDDLLDDFSIPDDNELIDENTPLHNAASRGHTNYLDALLQAGASPNSRDQYGNTLLHLSAMHGHMRSVQLLLERGARPNNKNKYGNTLVHVAALNGHTDMCMFLVEKGLKVSSRNNANSTPLHYACTRDFTTTYLE